MRRTSAGFARTGGAPGAPTRPGLARDAEGNVYLAGLSSSLELPLASGDEPLDNAGGEDVVVIKLSPAMDEILLVRTFGGIGDDMARSLVVLDDGRVIVCGRASQGFPTTPGALQEENAGDEDVFVVVLEPGEFDLEYATLYGAAGRDSVGSAALGSDGVLTIVGRTESRGFRVTDNAIQPDWGGGNRERFVLQIRPDGELDEEDQLVYSSFLGGAREEGAFVSPCDVAVRTDGRIAVVTDTESDDLPVTQDAIQLSPRGGFDVYIAIQDPSSDANPLYATYLGDAGFDAPRWVGWLDDRTVIVGGHTDSSNFPVTGSQSLAGGQQDGFLVAIDVESGALLSSTRFGGSNVEYPVNFRVTSSGDIVCVGLTNSANFPRASGCSFGVEGASTALLLRFDFQNVSQPRLAFSTSLGTGGVFGGNGTDEVLTSVIEDEPGVFIAAGTTTSSEVPVTDDALQLDPGGSSDFVLVRIDTRAPTAAFEVEPSIVPAPASVRFDATSSTGFDGASLETFDWDFGDGESGEGEIVEHTYDDGAFNGVGRYLATLAVTGRSASGRGGLRAETTREVTAFLPTDEDLGAWSAADVGVPRFPGGSRQARVALDSEFEICAGGTSLRGKAPSFHFLHQDVSGDFDLSADITVLEGGAAGARVTFGLLVRSGLDGDAQPHVALVVERSAGINSKPRLRVFWRDTGDHSDTRNDLGELSAHLRLTRRGTTFACYTSDDGANWAPVGELLTVTELSGDVFAGVALLKVEPTRHPSTFTPIVAGVASLTLTHVAPAFLPFVRSDCNGDVRVDVSDAICILNWLFAGSRAPDCLAAANVDGDAGPDGVGSITITDPIALLTHLFAGGVDPVAPYPECGLSERAADRLVGCERSRCVE